MTQKRKPREILETTGEEAGEAERVALEADEAERAALEAAREWVDEIRNEANALWQEGNYRETIPKYHRVIAEGEKVNHREAVIAAQKQIARCYYHLGYFEVALGYMERAASLSVLDIADENFFDSIKRKLWDK